MSELVEEAKRQLKAIVNNAAFEWSDVNAAMDAIEEASRADDRAKLERRITELESLAEERYFESRTLRAQLAAALALSELNTKENSR